MIGRHGAPWTLASARRESVRALSRLSEGLDPATERMGAMDIAKLHGLIIDKSRVQNENVKWVVSDQPLTNEDWEKEFCGGQTSEAVN